MWLNEHFVYDRQIDCHVKVYKLNIELQQTFRLDFDQYLFMDCLTK